MLATASSNITVWWCECVAGACCLILSYAISNLKPVLCSAAYKINPRAWGELAGTRWGALPWESNAGASHFCFSSGSPDSIRWQGRSPTLHLLFETRTPQPKWNTPERKLGCLPPEREGSSRPTGHPGGHQRCTNEAGASATRPGHPEVIRSGSEDPG